MQGLDFSVVPPYADILWMGVWWTAVLTVSAAAISFVFGVVFALVVLYAPKTIALPVRAFMWLFMGTPLLLQLFLIYYGLGQLGFKIPALVAGIIGLGLHFAVYNADILRAGIVAVDVGQTEGARSLGFGRFQTLRYFIVPQAVRNTIPAMGNNLIVLLKESSLVSIIG
ncbi:MAG: amino acid ABC transporter permease, partial [Ensifer adhaerens]